MARKVTGPAILIVLVLGLYLLFGCAAIDPAAPAAVPGPTRPVWLVTPGWHSGLVVRVADIPMDRIPERADFKDANYLEFGWGDRDYYRALESSPWLAVKAALIPGPGVLHVAGFDETPTTYFGAEAVLRVDLPDPAHQRLIGYLHDSFRRQGGARVPSLGQGLYGDSHFYEAEGRFHLFHNCNVWAALALRTAGLPLIPERAITAGGLRCQVERWGRLEPGR